MEDKKSGHISEEELNGLLNMAFINLDFENNSKNKEALAIVTKRVMRNDFIFSFFVSRRFNIFFLLLSLSICIASLQRNRDPLFNSENKKTSPSPEIKISTKTIPTIKRGKELDTVEYKEERLVKNVSIPIKVKKTRLKESRIAQSEKNNLSEIPLEKSIVDTALILMMADAQLKDDTKQLNELALDSNTTLQKTEKPKIFSTVKKTKTRPLKNVEPNKSNTKVKVAKRRKPKLFGRATKRRNKGNKFLKDSRGKFKR